MTVNNKLMKLGVLVIVAGVLVACDNSTYYDDSTEGTGIFHGGDSYRLRQSSAQYQPYQYARPSVASAPSTASEIRIFTDRSYRGDLGKLTTACARRAGVTGSVQVNTGFVKNEKFASLMPASNISAAQQERTAQCVEGSIK